MEVFLYHECPDAPESGRQQAGQRGARETHSDKYVGTKRAAPSLVRVYVLMSAFRDGASIVPVQFEVKEFIDKENKLYVAVTLKKTEAVDLNADPSYETTSASTASEISVPELIQKINPSDGDFLKYIPDSMLTDEQAASKVKALEKENSRLESMRIEYSEEQEGRKLTEAVVDMPAKGWRTRRSRLRIRMWSSAWRRRWRHNISEKLKS